MTPAELRKRRRERDKQKMTRAEWRETGGLVKIDAPDTSFDPFWPGILLGLAITAVILALMYAIAG